MSSYYGKYRGEVVNNIDPKFLGRMQVSVPAVLGDGRLSWAMPCVPYAGSGVGMFAIPPIGAKVWVEFEGGDPDYPIWTGCFWGLGELPVPGGSVPTPGLPQIKVLKTDSLCLTLSDMPGGGGFVLEVNPPAVAMPIKLTCDAKGVELTNGIAKITLTGPQISLNDGALDVV